MKKSLSVFLSLCIVFSMLLTGIVTAFAEGNMIEGTAITWSFNAETGELRFDGEGAIPDYDSYKNDSGDVDLKYPWKDVAYTSIVFGEGITGIGNYAFCYSPELVSVVIPDSVTVMGKGIFKCCYKLETVTMPAEVTEIGEEMFSACESLKSVTLGAKTEKIGKNVFYKCAKLDAIALPETLKSVDEGAFAYCTALKSTEFPEGFTTLGSRVFYACEDLETVVIPSTLESVGESAFDGCIKITSIAFPDSVTKLPADVCSGCRALESVTLPANLTEIGAGAFDICTSLKEITVPATVVSIGAKALGYGRWGQKVSGYTINGYANNGAVVKYANENGIKFNSIGYITNGVCGENATWEYNEEEKTLYIKGTGAMTDYTSESFVAYNLIPYEKVVIAPEITKIGNYAFYNAAAMDFTLLEKVEAIGEKAIGYYDNNGTATLREGTSITGYDATAAMTYAAENNITFVSLGKLIVTEGTLGENITWTYDAETKALNVNGSGETYNYTADALPEFAEYDIQSIAVSEDITVIGDYAFCTAKAYSEITFGSKVEKIGDKAFGFIKTAELDAEGNPTDATVIVPNKELKVRGYIVTPVDDYALSKDCGFAFEALDGDKYPTLSFIVKSVIDHINKFIIIYSENPAAAPDAEAIMAAFPSDKFTEVKAPEVFGTGAEFTVTDANGTYTYAIVVRGDITGEGKINSSDALAVLQHAVQSVVITEGSKLNASDINFDGKINSSDALAILQISVGLVNATDNYNPGVIR